MPYRRQLNLFAPICMICLGLFVGGCKPLLVEEMPPSRLDGQAVHPEQFKHGPPPPVPEVAWRDPPPCQPQAGETICAHLIYRTDRELHDLIWSVDGIVHDTRPLVDVPSGLTSFSPDFSQLVVQTPRGHTAGGPLYLYNLETEQLINLNEYTGLPIFTSISALRVAGWHQDSQQLLLVNEDDERLIWLDLANGSYQPLAVGIDSGQMSPPRQFQLAADGSGFTFISQSRDTTNRDNQSLYLYWYDRESKQTHQLLSVPREQGQLAATAIAPNGEQLVYLLLRGSRLLGRSEEVHLLDLASPQADSANSRLLLAGNLGPTEPVWSPDGQEIAFIRRELSGPRRAAPDQPPPLGDIWTLSIDGGEAVQRTFTKALDRPPIWSPDGNYLAFVTADGQIGMVAMDDAEMLWQMDSTTMRAPLIQLAFVPVESSQ